MTPLTGSHSSGALPVTRNVQSASSQQLDAVGDEVNVRVASQPGGCSRARSEAERHRAEGSERRL